MNELLRRVRWWFQRDRFERELEEEMCFHLDMKVRDAGGADEATQLFGNAVLIREDSRAMWTWTFWEQFSQDVKYGLRSMAGNKLFTGMAVLSLALGIGANTAIYSFMDAIMLRAMPVRNPEELVVVNWHARGETPVVQSHSGSDYDEAGGWSTSPNFPFAAYEELKKSKEVLTSLFAFAGAGRLNLVIDGQAELGRGEYVSGNYFEGVGINPAAGRLVGPDDDRRGASPVVAITYAFWQRRFGGESGVVGKSILINGKSFIIAGVAASGFTGVKPQNSPVLFLPVHQIELLDQRFNDADARFTGNHFYWIEMMGRLRPGVTLRNAQAQLAGQFNRFVTSTATNEKERANFPQLWLQEGGSGVDSLRREYSKPFVILMAMVALILAIACANIANLLLARSATRRRELAVRLSLGAGRLRVMRQLLTESVLLAICGATAGVFVAAMGIRGLTWLLANGSEDFTLHAHLDLRVLTFTLLIAVSTGILFGFAPAIQATRVDVTPALREARSSAQRTRRGRFGIPFGLSHVLVVSQIALSLLLVASAGLFVRTLGNLHAVQLGFNQENLLLFSLNANQAGYTDSAAKSLYGSLQRRFQSISEVRAASMSDVPMVSNWTSSTGVSIPGVPKPPGRGLNTSIARVGSSFFRTMEIPILQGRTVDERDREGTQNVAVINQVFAKKYFPRVDPIGRHFGLGGPKPIDIEIVGISKTARYNSLKRETPPVTYLSYLQTGNMPLEQVFFELRTAGDPLALANTVRRIVHQDAPLIPVADVTTQARRIDQTILEERTFAQLCSCFGVLALVMACVGLYGTMAYGVTRRTGEIGIRMALGARRRTITWMVLREVCALSIVGLMIGGGLVWETTVFLKSFLFGLKPNDPAVLAASAGILIAAAIAAGYAPAWRASRIDPMVALRHE